MDNCELNKALQVWLMAINAKLNGAHIDINELAHLYGCLITSPENIDEASHLFDWTKLHPLLERENENQKTLQS